MKQVWMANDGCIFDTEDECKNYERASCGVFYFTSMGKDTEELEEASVVFVRDQNSYLTNEYEFDTDINGPGWYVWSFSEHRYWCWDEVEELCQEYKDFINAKKNEGLVVKWD